jgi:hypothetical protein
MTCEDLHALYFRRYGKQPNTARFAAPQQAAIAHSKQTKNQHPNIPTPTTVFVAHQIEPNTNLCSGSNNL